jgi:PKD repeat protein
MRNNNFAIALLVAGITIVTGFSGCIGGNEVQSEVAVEYPVAEITAIEYKMQAGGEEPAFFNARNSTGNIVSYSWDFGDGEKGSGIEVEHIYAEPGYYNVTLTVKSKSGTIDTDVTTAIAWAYLENAVMEWTDPAQYGIIYPDDVIANLQTRPVVLFFWYDGCPWCTLQEAETNEIMDPQTMGPVKVYKVDVHATEGDLWGDMFRIYYVPTTMVIRQDGMFVALIGTQTYGTPAAPVANDGDVKPYIDEALQFKADNYASKIAEHLTSGAYNPTSGELQTIVDVPNGSTGISAWIKWNAADASGTAIGAPSLAGKFNVLLVAPDGKTYESNPGEFDVTVQKVPGNFLPDAYMDIALRFPMEGKWTIKFVASSEIVMSPYAYNVMVRSGEQSRQCENGVCPP